MDLLTYGFVASFLLLYGLISKRIRSTFLTGPMIFVVFGFLMSADITGLIKNKNHTLVNIIANMTLVLVLFSDASRIGLSLFKKEHDLPRRLLGIGLPITICFGVAAGLTIFFDLPLWQAAILGTILAPTDAALAQAVINSDQVPRRIRQALNVESGLNDGICFPILLLFISLADTTRAFETVPYWFNFIFTQLLVGAFIGIAIGYFGGLLVEKAVTKEWMSGKFQRLSVIALSFMAFCFSSLAGGNGFIASFFSGLVFGSSAKLVLNPIYEFGEAEGELFILLTFMVFGAVILPDALSSFNFSVLLYALVSLTAVRMLPVAMSLIGKKLSWPTILYIGWFGPRGAASILYLLIVVDQYNFSGETVIFEVTAITVLLSVFLHGCTAYWGANLYASYINKHPQEETEAEMKPVTSLPTRLSH